MKLRNPRGLDPTLTDIIRQALRDDQVVELAHGKHGMAIDVDGDRLVDGVAWESFDYPLHRGSWSDEQRDTIDDLLRRRERYKSDRKKSKIESSNHEQSEGMGVDE